ncbi:MAG: dihydrofolate reductase [Dysgonomonas sp.]
MGSGKKEGALISIIVAVDNNNAIGRGGDQLFYIPDDLRRFRELTTGHSIVMGRKTFDALPKGALPNRRNIVVSRKKNLILKDCIICHSLQAAFGLCNSEEEVFVIGGGEIYKQAMPIADKLYVTKVDYSAENADTFFPEISASDWQKISEEKHLADERNKYNYKFTTYIRIS